MPLLRKQNGQLTWQDLKEFLGQQVPENELLDYKGQSPSHIESVIAAMANTYGGDIIVGVGERAGDDGHPQPLAEVRGVPGRGQQSLPERRVGQH